ncbi:MAG: hypothetical protein ABIH99_04800 [Candidatus Micrarchaeota archaeon]
MSSPITRQMPNIAEKPTVKNHYIREAFQRYARKNWKLGVGVLFSVAVVTAGLTFLIRSDNITSSKSLKNEKKTASVVSNLVSANKEFDKKITDLLLWESTTNFRFRANGEKHLEKGELGKWQ